MAYAATRTKIRTGYGPRGTGMGTYGPYDTNYQNGYGPTAMAYADPDSVGEPVYMPHSNEWWVPRPSVDHPPASMKALAVGALIVGALFFFGIGAHA